MNIERYIVAAQAIGIVVAVQGAAIALALILDMLI